MYGWHTTTSLQEALWEFDSIWLEEVRQKTVRIKHPYIQTSDHPVQTVSVLKKQQDAQKLNAGHQYICESQIVLLALHPFRLCIHLLPILDCKFLHQNYLHTLSSLCPVTSLPMYSHPVYWAAQLPLCGIRNSLSCPWKGSFKRSQRDSCKVSRFPVPCFLIIWLYTWVLQTLRLQNQPSYQFSLLHPDWILSIEKIAAISVNICMVLFLQIVVNN